jgi:hypothetical protein
MWSRVVSRGRWGALSLFISLSGCTAMSDCKYEFGQKVRTSQAWLEFDGCNEECFSSDYRSGWKAGYYDVATGGTGIPPVIAPRKYWKPPVFCEHDPSRRDDWYCGFQDGAACAKCQPDYHYLQTFLPGPDCCPVHLVSHSPLSHPSAEFPLQPMVDDPAGLAPPATVPGAGISPADEQTGAPSQKPSGGRSDGADPSKNDYEEDPEPQPAPTSSSSQRNTDTILWERVVEWAPPTEARSQSLLEQLVLNASQNESSP